MHAAVTAEHADKDLTQTAARTGDGKQPNLSIHRPQGGRERPLPAQQRGRPAARRRDLVARRPGQTAPAHVQLLHHAPRRLPRLSSQLDPPGACSFYGALRLASNGH